jgi:hypothetical protein
MVLVNPDGGLQRPVPLPGWASGYFAFSWDGKQIAYETADRTVAIVPLAGGTPRALPGPRLALDEHPVGWTTDDRSLLIQRGEDQVPAVVWRIDVSTGQRSAWKEIQPTDSVGVIYISPIVLAADGSYAYNYRRVTSSDLYVVEGLR